MAAPAGTLEVTLYVSSTGRGMGHGRLLHLDPSGMPPTNHILISPRWSMTVHPGTMSIRIPMATPHAPIPPPLPRLYNQSHAASLFFKCYLSQIPDT